MPTYGTPGASKTQYTVNWNQLLTSTLFNYNKKLHDNISKRNVIMKMLKNKGAYTSVEGGIAIEENLMYALGAIQYFQGYDVLRRENIDGVTKAVYDWTQAAANIQISDDEKFKNKGKAKVLDLLQTKIKQAEMGLKEDWLRDMLQGKEGTLAGGGIINNAIDPISGASGLDPLAKLVAYDPTASLVVGGINQATAVNSKGQFWWRNKTMDAGGTALSPELFLQKFTAMYMACSNNSEGSPDLILVDDVTYLLLETAMRHTHRDIDSYKEYPDFENFRFKNAMVTWDDRIPNALGNNLDTTVATGKGTAYFLNTDYMKIRYEVDSDFVNTPFMRPVDQLADVSYIVWRGAITLTNRRVHGVMGNIPRSLTIP